MPLSYYEKGIMYKRKNFMGPAVKCFEEARKLEEKVGSKASLELAKIYAYFKDYEEAYKYCKEAISKSNYIEAYYLMVRILLLSNTPINEILKKAGKVKIHNSLLADIFCFEGNYEVALKIIDTCLKEDEVTRDLELIKIKCLLKLKQYDKCKDYIDNFSQSYLYFFKIRMYKVICCVLLEEYRLAWKIIDEFDYKKLSLYNKNKLKAYINFYNAALDIRGITPHENDEEYYSCIFEIIDILLATKEIKCLKKLIQTISKYDGGYLELAELYSNYGYVSEAKKLIVLYIKKFEVVNNKMIYILQK
ncbi:TPR-repeats containing protein [Clostridium acetobutylicum EA 2018]|uniref:TPR-repeats containing protein n=3 Tax=Clostridiaceae TaxID=31979 RepID=Q97E13_CLOAB|nr:TPR-repeats containing protein [Clostridium acetobutylicum ATCC 824]ADZ22346.1 TPR-repeats containing protein [Clostridium acetobutylicum EA 2018]AEI32757.1 TPR repeat-containing protein [Clostridium acetobutylicum DSM 1731]AWV81091.1 hypothetical protein DK921_13480 [Clostridium acetobutylicum]PSM05677.1 hypothetical protein C7T89_13480 [Clostridium sp. NJ4]